MRCERKANYWPIVCAALKAKLRPWWCCARLILSSALGLLQLVEQMALLMPDYKSLVPKTGASFLWALPVRSLGWSALCLKRLTHQFARCLKIKKADMPELLQFAVR
jgi:hypothetical protein